MPVYTYECENCGRRFEAKQSFNDDPLTVCPECGGKIRRVIQPVGVVFKGSGFYVTDSRGKQNLATPGTKKEDTKTADGNGSGDAGKTKTDAAAKSDAPAKSESTTSSSTSSTSSTTSSSGGSGGSDTK